MKKISLLCLSVFLILTLALTSIQTIRAITDEPLNALEETRPVSDSVIIKEKTLEGSNFLQSSDSTNLNMWYSVYNPTDDQKKEITSLIKNGADPEIVIKICEFWEDTDAPFSIIAEIYAKAPEADALAQIYDHTVWIESAYNEITGNDNNLSVQDVKEYLSLGVSLDDLYAANRAARKSTVNTKDVLDRRIAGDDWIEIIAPHIANDFSTEERNHISGHDVLDSLIIERKTDTDCSQIIKTALESNESVMSTYSAIFAHKLDTNLNKVTSEGGINYEEQ